MQRTYCGNSESVKKSGGMKHISDVINVLKKAQWEAEKELESIRKCPAPCSDRTVEIITKAGNYARRQCPIADLECEYGKLALQGLEKYLDKVMCDIGVPQLHLNNFTNVRNTVAVAKASAWNVTGFLILYGSPRNGKSFGAAWFVRELLKRKIPDMLDHATWGQIESESLFIAWRNVMKMTLFREALSDAINAPLLIIDDLGGEDDVRSSKSAVCSLINERYESQKPTVITTRLTIKEIGDRYGKDTAFKATNNTGRGGKVIDCGNTLI